MSKTAEEIMAGRKGDSSGEITGYFSIPHSESSGSIEEKVRVVTARLIDFCENCAKVRPIALVPVGPWFIWMCWPCQTRHAMRMFFSRLFYRRPARERTVHQIG